MVAAGLFTACENDIDPKIPEDAVSPTLTAPTEGGVFVFQKTDEALDFKTFVWTKADLKLNANVTYNLEIDAKTGDFSNRKIISSNISSPFKITIGDFNKGMLAAGFEEGTAHNIKVRIVASNALASKPLEMTITPYFDAEPWSVIGSAVGGWNLENDKFMTYNKDSETYSITVDMKPGEFKFRAPQKDKNDPWKYNYGINGGKIIDNGSDIKLKDGGDNIGVSGGNYTIVLDIPNEKFSITQNSAAEFTIWTDVVLDAVGTGISADNANATADPSSWNWGNVMLADNEGKPSASAAVYTWKWTAITLEANEGFKLRTLNGVASPLNGISFDAGFDKVDVDASSTKVVDKDGNISVSEKGQYTIELSIDATNGDAKKIVITEYFEYPPTLFAIGDAANGWDWGNGDGVAMIPVHSHAGLFWRIMYLEGGKGLKFAPQEAWSNDFGTDKNQEPVNGVYQKGGDNITVPESKYYMVVVNLVSGTIELAEPAVYGMGDAFGGWNAAKPENKFTVNNEAKTISFASVPGNGKLRMHATATTMNCDWWQAEFNIINGDIVYRADGGDQDAPDVVAGKSITLNFSTMKGEIK